MFIFGGASVSSSYQVARSLRFRASASAYLSRTMGTPTDGKKGTLSWWQKKSSIIGTGATLNAYSAGTSSFGQIAFANTTSSPRVEDTIYVYDDQASAGYMSAVGTSRDPSAWDHFVLRWDTTAGTKLVIEKNGVAMSLNGANTYWSGTTGIPNIGLSGTHNIGRLAFNGTQYFNGYIAEMRLIDGQSIAASNFGAFDSNGIWQPKAYTGTYGANGFYLDFSDNSSTTNVCLDRSGNGNNWTPNNISVTAGTTNDSLVDTPTNYGTDDYLGGSVRGNYATFDPLWPSPRGALSNGNLALVCAGAAANFETARATQVMTVPTYWETVVPADRTYAYHGILNVALAPLRNGNSSLGVLTTAYPKSAAYCALNGRVYYNSDTQLATYTAATTGQIIGHAYNPATGKYWVRVNGTWQNSGDPAAGTGQVATADSTLSYVPAISDATSQTVDGINFGQRPFANTAPTGFKALCAQNLSTPAIPKPKVHFDVALYTSTNAAKSIVTDGSVANNALLVAPDLVVIKDRSSAQSWKWSDRARGVIKGLISDTTGDETTDTNGVTSFDSAGFTIGNGTRNYGDSNLDTYVAALWKAGGATASNSVGSITSQVSVNTTAGISIGTYTGQTAAGTVGHGLGIAPGLIIVKARTTAGTDQGWAVYHSSLANTEHLLLNSTAAKATGSSYWNSTTPTSTVFSIGTLQAPVNTLTDTYGFMAFSEISGFSKAFTYTGNAAADGPFVWLGFRPKWILLKSSSTTDAWLVYDSARDTYNVAPTTLVPNTSAADAAISGLDFLSNGFKLRTITTTPNAAQTYVGWAFAEYPFKYARAR